MIVCRLHVTEYHIPVPHPFRALGPRIYHVVTPPSTNYADSIFHDPGTGILFASFKYVGTDFDADMKKMAANRTVREWWKMTDGMQDFLVPGAVSNDAVTPSWWKPGEEVFYCP